MIQTKFLLIIILKQYYSYFHNYLNSKYFDFIKIFDINILNLIDFY